VADRGVLDCPEPTEEIAVVSPETEAAGQEQAGGDAADVRIKDLPKEVGAMLVSVGVLGVVLPGMMGAPAIIAGGMVLWPGTFGKVESWFQRRYPELHKQGMRQISRYLDDLERRYSHHELDQG
jgi:hypothetical protein